ncbi:50S ribosomal protein L6 [Thecamonas trahens ATCC 50062]|uniref:50S ribosomal protein L6 n=1 Tax=Thecamonas trahens ATCC 50062 TaxID=461836 RepID=A0A0L0DLC2_THETB|nr:50S ribosomal protein L6 [Thecamonas trahens ATCC 50062]KNC53092.1 50S ribosomal protein L6 [Thecamonas trahens ATCC 50062]|eukprot:XP_013754762.1 50S ribosomal protein L6 [Thecamonas trahens ATCC 50062]
MLRGLQSWSMLTRTRGFAAAAGAAGSLTELEQAALYRKMAVAVVTGGRSELETLVKGAMADDVPLRGPLAEAALKAAMFVPQGTLLEAEADLDLVQHGAHHAIRPKPRAKRQRALFGTVKSAVASVLEGLDRGYVKRLNLVGVGYRAWLGKPSEGKALVDDGSVRAPVAAPDDDVLWLKLGYSHDVEVPIPDGLAVKVIKDTTIVVEGIHKQQVGEFAAQLRRHRKPDAYKGKGVRYDGEVLTLKQGKRN